MNIRTATLKDCNACHELSKIRELLTAKKEPVPLDYFKEIVGKSVFLVAEENNVIVGYSTADLLPGRVAIWWLLAVDPNFQNKGIGTKLSQEIEKCCKEKNVKYIVGYTPKFNLNTHQFHEKNGFIIGEEMLEILKEI